MAERGERPGVEAVIFDWGGTLTPWPTVDFLEEAQAPAGASAIRLPAEGVNAEELIDDLVRQALERTKGNQSASARLLGLSRDQVRYRIEKFGLPR